MAAAAGAAEAGAAAAGAAPEVVCLPRSRRVGFGSSVSSTFVFS